VQAIAEDVVRRRAQPARGAYAPTAYVRPSSGGAVPGAADNTTELEAVANKGNTPGFSSGTYAAIPATGMEEGDHYTSTDAPVRLWRYSGSAWVLVATADHGTLGGLTDDDHTQYVKHSLATALSDFLVASGSGAWVKKTLAEVKTILGLGTAAYTAAADYALVAGRTGENQTVQGFLAQGAGNTARKVMVITGNKTPAAGNSTLTFTHGVPGGAAKIRSITAIMTFGNGAIIQSNTTMAGYEFWCYVAAADTTKIVLATTPSNSGSVLDTLVVVEIAYVA
jgi:hypothetical protein